MGRKARVLLVAADAMARNAAVDRLSLFDYEVLTARDAGEALGVLQSDKRVQVLVTDVELGSGCDGLALAKTARNLDPRIGVVYTSAAPQRIPAHAKVSGAPTLRTPYFSQQLVGVLGNLAAQA